LTDAARCPSCRSTMTRVIFGRRSGVVIDVCAMHGTWFDAGELTKVLTFAANEGDAPPPGDKSAPRDPRVTREEALAQNALLEERLREVREIRRWSDAKDDFLEWLNDDPRFKPRRYR
jgi:Zn-finger nucleic acid-binding protein